MSIQISLNHMCAPRLSVLQLLELSATLGCDGIEVRNDLGSADPFGGISETDVRAAAERSKQRIFTINALQRFDDRKIIARSCEELGELSRAASSVGIPAIVFCPVNDKKDARSSEARFDEAVANLRDFAPILESKGIRGYIEPLGFEECAIRSMNTAFRIIEACGATCYATVLDTFHHALGTDDFDDFRSFPMGNIGLVHLSWVDSELPTSEYTDENRILFTDDDLLRNGDQLAMLADAGFSGVVSFEPFSSSVHKMSSSELSDAVGKSLAFVREALF